MYSNQPLPPIDTINSHGGFFIVCIIAAIWLLILIFNEDQEYLLYRIITAGIPVMAVLVTGYFSWTTGEIKYYKNEPVIGELVTFVAKEHSRKISTGKNSYRDEIYSVQYVKYDLGESILTFATVEGQAYPKRAVFYKN